MDNMHTDPKPPNSFSLGILSGIQAKHIYAGTVPAETVRQRRTANKVARRSRRINRKG